MRGWDDIKAKLEQLEAILEIQHGEGQIVPRIALIVDAAIAQRTNLEAARRELDKWKGPAMEAAMAMGPIYEMVRAEIERQKT